MTSAPSGGAPNRPGRPTHIAFVVTHPMTVRYLLRGQTTFLTRQGFDISVLYGLGDEVDELEDRVVQHYPIRGLGREIRPTRDLFALIRIFRVLRRVRPDIVNASTPKAGFLGMLAALLARVPCRIYTQRGLRLETTRGFKRWILTALERISARCANHVVCVSESLRSLVLTFGLAPEAKTTVLGVGSSNGVDTKRFHAPEPAAELELRRATGLPEGAPVIGFVGRLTRDKGIEDLVIAFTEQVLPRLPSARLLIVGDFERGDQLDRTTKQRLERNPAVVLTGFVKDSAPYFRLMSVLALPSYREGFPNAPLEASATAIPVVGYAATGTIDAVEDGVTGTLVPLGNTEALGRALASYLVDEELRLQHGRAGRARAVEHFARELVWSRWESFYRSCLRDSGAPAAGVWKKAP